MKFHSFIGLTPADPGPYGAGRYDADFAGFAKFWTGPRPCDHGARVRVNDAADRVCHDQRPNENTFTERHRGRANPALNCASHAS